MITLSAPVFGALRSSVEAHGVASGAFRDNDGRPCCIWGHSIASGVRHPLDRDAYDVLPIDAGTSDRRIEKYLKRAGRDPRERITWDEYAGIMEIVRE